MTEPLTHPNPRSTGTNKTSTSETKPSGKKAMNYTIAKAQNTDETNNTYDADTSSKYAYETRAVISSKETHDRKTSHK